MTEVLPPVAVETGVNEEHLLVDSQVFEGVVDEGRGFGLGSGDSFQKLLFEQSAVGEDIVDAVEGEHFDSEIPWVCRLVFIRLNEFRVGLSFTLLHNRVFYLQMYKLFGFH